MPKPELEFFSCEAVDWTPVAGDVAGLWERILVRDEEGGVVTRILRFDPGTDTTANGVQVHPYWEEVYILEGALHDLTLDQTFSPGSYACRPPGMRHGPWVAPDGCLTFEVRYASGGSGAGPGGEAGDAKSEAGSREVPGPVSGRGTAPPFSTAEFRRACGQFATGVTIVTARAPDGSPVGLTANSFTSVSLEPPLVLVCLEHRLRSYRAFMESGRYAVHVLPEHQAVFSTRFATRGIDKFAGLTYRLGLGGIPILPGYLALFECAVEHAYDGGDHTILMGRVERLEVGHTARPPLAFFRGAFVRLHEEEVVAPVAAETAALWAMGWA